jgi:hypothetical protein
LDIVDAMLTEKELMLSPFGIVFEPPPDDVDDGLDDPHAAAARLTTAARLTQPTPRKRRSVPRPCEREGRPPLLLLLIAAPIPLSPEGTRMIIRDTIQEVYLVTNYTLVTM